MDGQRDEAMARVAAALRQALTRPTVHGLDGLLDPDVRWGGIEETEQTCHGRAQVLAFYSRLLEEGVSLEVRDLRVDGEHIRLQMRVRRPSDDGGIDTFDQPTLITVREDCASWTCCERSMWGAPSGTRTPNPLIKSQLLCQLS